MKRLIPFSPTSSSPTDERLHKDQRCIDYDLLCRGERGGGRKTRRHRLPVLPARPGEADGRAGNAKERRMSELPHRFRPQDDARDARRWCSAARTATAVRPRCSGPTARWTMTPRGTPRMYNRATPESWHYPSSANPERSYTLLNRESPEFTRFINPSDYRVASEACGACHQPIIGRKRSQHDGHGRDAVGRRVVQQRHPAVQELHPWRGLHARRRARPPSPGRRCRITCKANTACCRHCRRCRPGKPSGRATYSAYSSKADAIFRTSSRKPGCRTSSGRIQRLEEPGRPDIRQSNRGPGDRCAYLGAADQYPQDATQRSVHLVHGHQRPAGRLPALWLRILSRRLRQRPRSATLGSVRRIRSGRRSSASVDPTIPDGERGHPIRHEFTRAIPTSQCMVCHMHQPKHVHELLSRLHDVGLRIGCAVHVAGGTAGTVDRGTARGARSKSRGCGCSRQMGRRRFPAQRDRPERATQRYAVCRLPRPWMEFPCGPETRSRRQPARCQRADRRE